MTEDATRVEVNPLKKGGVQIEVQTDAGSKILLDLSYEKAAELSGALTAQLGRQAVSMHDQLRRWVAGG